MNFWKTVAIGCIGYIAGNRVGPSRSYYTSGRYVRRYNNINLKDELIDIFSGKLYDIFCRYFHIITSFLYCKLKIMYFTNFNV